MSYEHVPEASLTNLTRQKENVFVEDSRKARKRQIEDKENFENVQLNKVQITGDCKSIKIQATKYNEKGKENIDNLERNEEKSTFQNLSKIHNLLVVDVKDIHKSKVIKFILKKF
jgi:hypothetical protein